MYVLLLVLLSSVRPQFRPAYKQSTMFLKSLGDDTVAKLEL